MMLGLGIDAVDVPRFRDVLARSPRLVTLLFTSAECEAAERRADATQMLAARFAVREATMKALGVGLGAFDFHDVSVSSDARGQPHLLVSGRAAQLAATRGVQQWHVSITHTDQTAIAVVAAN